MHSIAPEHARTQAVVFSFRDALQFVFAMDGDAGLCPRGFTPDCVAKLDIAKLREPKEWGWRFLAFDFVMPNHQIVECYVVFTEMEHAKKHEDPRAAVCAELSNHEIFEKWRVVDTAALGGEAAAEFEADKAESNRRYDEAFDAVLTHTSEAELEAFWAPFGLAAGTKGSSNSSSSGDGNVIISSNPIWQRTASALSTGASESGAVGGNKMGGMIVKSESEEEERGAETGPVAEL